MLGLVVVLVFVFVVVVKGNVYYWEMLFYYLFVLVGIIYIKECGNVFILGIDYEYCVSDFLGVGFVVEYVFEDLDVYIYLFVVDLYIINNFIV